MWVFQNLFGKLDSDSILPFLENSFVDKIIGILRGEDFNLKTVTINALNNMVIGSTNQVFFEKMLQGCLLDSLIDFQMLKEVSFDEVKNSVLTLFHVCLDVDTRFFEPYCSNIHKILNVLAAKFDFSVFGQFLVLILNVTCFVKNSIGNIENSDEINQFNNIIENLMQNSIEKGLSKAIFRYIMSHTGPVDHKSFTVLGLVSYGNSSQLVNDEFKECLLFSISQGTTEKVVESIFGILCNLICDGYFEFVSDLLCETSFSEWIVQQINSQNFKIRMKAYNFIKFSVESNNIVMTSSILNNQFVEAILLNSDNEYTKTEEIEAVFTILWILLESTKGMYLIKKKIVVILNENEIERKLNNPELSEKGQELAENIKELLFGDEDMID